MSGTSKYSFWYLITIIIAGIVLFFFGYEDAIYFLCVILIHNTFQILSKMKG